MDRLAQVPPRRVRAIRDALCLAAGLASVAWLVPALWPGACWPAWPSVSLGVLAYWLGAGPGGRPLMRGLARTAGVFGCLLGSAQIVLLWMIALITP